MSKHSSRLILKISYFRISASELVLRNKIRFVARVRNVDNNPSSYCIFDICLFIIYSYNSPSGYCAVIFFQWPLWLLCRVFLCNSLSDFHFFANVRDCFSVVEFLC